jgi:hypothetical protein
MARHLTLVPLPERLRIVLSKEEVERARDCSSPRHHKSLHRRPHCGSRMVIIEHSSRVIVLAIAPRCR